MSPWRFLGAAHLVSKTFVRLDEIAATVGYEHPRHLERCFLAVLGVRPTELRGYYLREACRAHLRGRNDALFAVWVSNRLPLLIAQGDGPNWLRPVD